MLKDLLSRVMGDPSEREVARLKPSVDEINHLANELKAMSDADLRALTLEFRTLVSESTVQERQRLADLRAEIAVEESADQVVGYLDAVGF